MLAVLIIVLPIFALIFAGWGTRRLGVLGPHATSELNRFVVYLALPALLFDIVANAHWHDIWRPVFIAAFGAGALLTFGVTIAWRMRRGRHLADAAIDGLNAGYANTGFVGFPLALAIIGPAAQTPTLVATIITVCVLFALGIVLIEIGLQTERSPLRMAARILGALARNPLLLAPIAGAVFLAFGIRPPLPVESFVKLLGAAASPCALVALGLFLAERRDAAGADPASVLSLVGLKLLAQPLLTWALATWVFAMPAGERHLAVLLAALPTGTGPFMLAEFYGREAGITSRAVLVSTIVSLVTITLYLSVAA